MKKITSVPPLCKISTVAGRSLFEIESERNSPHVALWWDWESKHEEVLLIRQEAASGALQADVLHLTHSQAYALLDALNRALELP